MDLARTLGGRLLQSVLLLCVCLAAQAQSLQPIPALTARVMDLTGTLRSEQTQAMEARLQAFEQAKGTQIVVLMVATTAPEDITDYTQRAADLWKIGRKQVGDGLLLVIAKNDRTLRIATAKTLEGAIPDLAARQVIERNITPRFRVGDYAGGIDAGLSALMALISGEKLPEPERAPSGTDWSGALVFFFFAVPILARIFSALLGRKAGSLLTGMGVGLLAWLISASAMLAIAAGVIAAVYGLASTLMSGLRHVGDGRGSRAGSSAGGSWGGGWSSGSNDGFRSGGGGDFGGGGASGRW
ncbi:MAG: TPM domain-containing protein [Betaproteobacteria bacterium]